MDDSRHCVVPISKKDYSLACSIFLKEFGEPLVPVDTSLKPSSLDSDICERCGAIVHSARERVGYCPHCGARVVS